MLLLSVLLTRQTRQNRAPNHRPGSAAAVRGAYLFGRKLQLLLTTNQMLTAFIACQKASDSVRVASMFFNSSTVQLC